MYISEPYKTSAVRPFAFHLQNHSVRRTKRDGYAWRKKNL